MPGTIWTRFALMSTLFCGNTIMAGGADLLLDDFVRDDGRSALGTDWTGFTDRVMGGLSGSSCAVRLAPGICTCERLTAAARGSTFGPNFR